jgi:hypothetical protein
MPDLRTIYRLWQTNRSLIAHDRSAEASSGLVDKYELLSINS